MVLIKI